MSSFVVNLAAIVVFSRIAGPFMLTPTIIVGILLSFTSNPRMLAKPWLIALWGLLAVMLPITLELTGVIPKTFEVVNGAILTTSEFYRLKGPIEEIALIVANAGFVATSALFAFGVSRNREDVSKKLHVQAWHLRQLLPTGRSWRTQT